MSTDAIAERFAAVLTGAPGDLSAFYRDAREEAPIFRSDAFDGWVVSRYADVRRVLTDEEHFGPLQYGGGSSIIHGRTILQMGGEEHRRKSAILARHLRNTRLLEGVQRAYVRELSERLVEQMPAGETVDVKAAFTTPMPLQVIAWLMGIEGAPDFRETYDRIVAAGASNLRGDPDVQRRGEVARAELMAYVMPLIAERRKEPGDDLLSTLCTTEVEGEGLSDEEVGAFCSFLLAAGVETTDRALSSMLKHLWSHPEHWELLRRRRDLVPAACVESLRLYPPVHALSRGVLADTELAGQDVRTGARVVVLMGAANRDPEVFPDPDAFVIERFAGNPGREFGARAEILSFGHGRHLCTGSLLARLEMLEGLEVLLDRFAGAEFSTGVPDDRGYVLRSPEHLRVALR